MVWLAFALLANFLYSVANIVDQLLRKRHFRHTSSLIVLWAAFYLIFFIPAAFFIDVSIPPLPQLASAVSAGALIIGMVVIYVYAISREEVSRAMSILQFNSVFALLLAVTFLGEILTPVRYAGFAVILLAGFIISVEKIGSRLSFSRPLLLMLAGAAVLAVSSVLMKFFYLTGTFWNGFFWFVVGNYIGIAALLLWPGTIKGLRKCVPLLNMRTSSLLLLTSASTFAADLSIFFAIKEGPVSLVAVVGSTQVAVLFLLALFLSRFFPRVLKERTDRKTLLTKSSAIALMIVGLALLNGGV